MMRPSISFWDVPQTRAELVEKMSRALARAFEREGVPTIAAQAAALWIATDPRLIFDMLSGRPWLLFAEGDKFLPRLFHSKEGALAECRRMLGREADRPMLVAVNPLLLPAHSARWGATRYESHPLCCFLEKGFSL